VEGPFGVGVVYGGVTLVEREMMMVVVTERRAKGLIGTVRQREEKKPTQIRIAEHPVRVCIKCYGK
jgi:hypothetical protein